MANTVRKQKCLRCEHEWFPESEKLPKYCPKCKTPYWNRERRNGLTAAQKKAVLAGEIQRIINDYAGDPVFKSHAENGIIRTRLSHSNDLPKNSLAELDQFKAAIEKEAKESQERAADLKECETNRARLISETMQFAEDTGLAAVIQQTKETLDLMAKLPANLTTEYYQDFRNKLERDTRPERDAVAKRRAELAKQPRLAGLNEA